MKLKKLLVFSVMMTTSLAIAGTNLTDAVDANEIEAEEERRINEEVNLPDAADWNLVPGQLEERQKEEEWRKGYDEVQDDVGREESEQEVRGNL